MRTILVMLGMVGILTVSHSIWAAQGSIAKEYQGMWGAGGCSKAKYFMHIESTGMQMYASDKRMPLGNWDVRKVQDSGKSIIIDAPETNSHKPTHMELTRLPNGHLSLLLKIGGNGGVDELTRC